MSGIMSQYTNNSIFKDVQAVTKHITPLKKKGKTIVTTNGCFDILHAGHIQYLSETASQGDILVVGVNSDDVVRKLKGGNRPIQDENARVSIIGALKMVDCAFIFYEYDPRAFLKVIKPDIHVKGGDYSEDIIEKPVVEAHGGRISIVSYINGCSTTDILSKIISRNK